MSYNLDENASESFEFTLGGHKYQMRYPTTEEIEKVKDLKDDPEKANDWMYSYITPADEGSPSIKEALAKVNVKILQRFNIMIEEEFGMKA